MSRLLCLGFGAVSKIGNDDFKRFEDVADFCPSLVEHCGSGIWHYLNRAYKTSLTQWLDDVYLSAAVHFLPECDHFRFFTLAKSYTELGDRHQWYC